MGRTFAYCRVSTSGQHAENQMVEISGAGIAVETFRVVEERISGSTKAMSRPMFARLVDRLEPGDVLVVTKLDRLGRDAIDVLDTVRRLDGMGVRVQCLALGGVDLTSPVGTMTMHVIAAMAEFERDLIIERVRYGVKRAKESGTHCGRKASIPAEDASLIKERLESGESASDLAREYGVSRQLISRIRIGTYAPKTMKKRASGNS